MIAVFFAGAAALTLLPALLGFVGPKIDSLSIRKRRSEESRIWHRWAILVMRRPWAFLIACLIIVGALAFPALHLKLGSSGPSILPRDSGPRIASEIAAKAFGEGQVAPVQILVTDPRGVTTAGFADLYRLTGDADLENLGLRDWLADPDTWVVLEWPERAPALAKRCDLVLEFADAGDDARRVSLRGTSRAGIEALEHSRQAGFNNDR